MKNYLLVNRALAAEKKINLIEMLQGCSKRNGTTFRQSNPDGQTTVKRQSRLMLHRGYLRNLAMIFAVLVMSIANIGTAWGGTINFTGSGVSTNFTETKSNSSNITTTENQNSPGGSYTGKALKIEMKNNSSLVYTIVSKTSYENISQIVFNFGTGSSARDAIKLGVDISSKADFSSDVTTLMDYSSTWKASYKSYSGNDPDNSKMYEVSKSVSNKTGYIRFRLTNTSAGKTAFLGTITITTASGGGCSAPAAPTIGGTATYTAGETITLTASCASGADASTTYTWYKGTDWATAKAGSAVQTAKTAAAGGTTYSKASCVVGDAGTYWCEAANSTCTSHNATGKAVTVAATHTVTATTDNASYGTAAAASTTVAEGATTTITATPKSGYAFDHWTVSGTGATLSSTTTNPTTLTMGTANATVTAYFVEKSCPSSGTLYTLTMKNATLSSVTQNTEVALATTYATESGGTAYLGNKNSDGGKAQVSTTGSGSVFFNGNDAYIKVDLDCPLATGDIITFTLGSGTKEICFTTDKTRATTYKTSSQSYTCDAAFNEVSTIYIWRVDGGTYLHSLTISRPATPSCTAPNHVDVSGNWDYFGGETINLTATAYSSAGTGSPIAAGSITGYQWQKLVGTTWTNVTGANVSGATSANLQITNCTKDNSGKYRCVVSTGATCSTASATKTDGTEGYGVKVFVLAQYAPSATNHNFTRVGSTDAGTLEINLTANQTYEFEVVGDDQYYGNTGTISGDVTNWVMTSGAGHLKLTSGSAGGTITVTMDYSTGGNNSTRGIPELSVVYPKKRIYMRPSTGDGWAKNNPKFFIHSWGLSDYDALMTEMGSCDAGVYYADIYASNTSCLFTRQNPTDGSINTGSPWNKSNDITIGSNDYFYNSGWSAAFTGGTYSTPTYTISYNAGTGGSGTKASESKTCGVDFTLPNSAVFTRTGYTQTGWTTSDGGAQTHALGGSYTDNAAQTFYPVWTAKTCTVSFDNNEGTGGTNTVTATYGSAMPSKASNLPTRDGYTFDGYWDSETNNDGTGTQYYKADGTSKMNWDKDVTATQTLYAKWNCITPDAPTASAITATDGCGAAATFSAEIPSLPSYVTWYWQTSSDGTSTSNPASTDYTTDATAGSKTIYLRAKNTVCDTWSASGSTPSKSAKVKTAATVSWSAHPTSATYGDGGKTFSVTTNYESGLAWTLENNTCGAALTGSGTSRTLSYTGVGSVDVKATVTGAGDSYCSSAVVSETITVGAATPTATFANGEYTIGGSALDLSTLWTSNSGGTVTYSVTDANGTGATVAGSSFTATTAGTASVRASQAANGNYSAITKDATITVNAAADVTAPTLSNSNPANGATGVATSGTIVLTFSEAINIVDGTKFTLTGATKGVVAIDGSDDTKVNVPYSGAANSATVTLTTAASAVSDAAGNASAALSNISFTTVAAAPAGDCEDLFVGQATDKSTFTASTGSATTALGSNGGAEFSSGGYSYSVKPNSTNAIVASPKAGKSFAAGDSLIFVVYNHNDGAKEMGFTLGSGTTKTSVAASTLHKFRIKLQASDIVDGKVTFNRQNGDDRWVAITIKHCEAASCDGTPAAPTSPTNGATAATTQVVSWTDGSNDKWDVYVSTSSSTPAAGVTPIASGLTAKTYTFTGLTASTTYYWWVRSVCDDTHKSAWVAGTSFTTSAATLYTVTFNSNGGSDVSPITQASEGASITMPAAPTYASHTFQGWVIGGTTKAAGDSYTPTANITAYATWKENCAGGGGNTVTIVPATGYSSQAEKGGSTYVTFTSAPTLNYKYKDENNNTVNNSTDSRTQNNAYGCTIASNSSYRGSIKTTSAYNNVDSISFYFASPSASSAKVIVLYSTDNFDKDSTTLMSATAVATSNSQFRRKTLYLPVGKKANDLTFKFRFAPTSSGVTSYIDSLKIFRSSGYSCYYVTYDGNEAETGSISDATAYTSGTNVTVLGNVDSPAAFTKTGYRFNGWNTAPNGSGMAYAAGATFAISGNVTLYAQWVLDACSAPAAPTISGTASRTVGQNIELTATCASGADGSTTYTWYKGVDWATASAASPVQAAMTAGEGGRTFTKATCVEGDAGKYWCEASNGTGCEAHNATGFTVTVSAAVAEHIYYYKDANHYSEGTYSNPEGNTAASGDNKSLSSPWMICNGCKAGVDSVVAHGATYDGKGNWVDAYIKLPSGGDASTKNIKFALATGYTGTLKIKMGKYKDSSTLPTASLKLNGAGEAISPTSGGPDGVATTEDNFSTTTWNLSTAGGTYILTVSSANAYISQIDMTTTATATFRVTYDGNGKTGGTVPTDNTDYSASASVTVKPQGELAKTNYTFGGWNTANNGTGTNYVAGSGTFSIKGATTLYAHWTQTINLAPGAKGTGSLGATVSWNGTAVRGFTAHTAAGYSLTGYYTAPSDGTKVLNADGSFAATNVTDYITDGKWSRTGAAATLYAQWESANLLKWNLRVNTAESPIVTTSKESAAPLAIPIATMSNLDSTSLTIEASKRGSLTSKIETPSSYDPDKYMSVQFVVASGYKLVPSAINVKVQPVSNGKYAKLVLSDNNSHEISYTTASTISSGTIETVTMRNDGGVEFTGTVTLKIYCYGATDKYRLGTPIEINGSVEETCTPPTFSGLDYSATEYTQGNPASAISVTGAANVELESCQWKYSTVNDRTSGTNCGTGASVTPSTASTGTLYYWCELTNGCTTVKTSTVAITVTADMTEPTVTWSDVKLNGAATTVNYGGGKYELRATVNEGWSGTLESSMVTAPAGIYIHNIGTGTDGSSRRYIEFQFDVTTAFDREENETIGFHLSLPESGSWSACTSDKQVSYTACDEGEGAGGMIYLPVKSTQTTAKSGMQYYWESTGSGRLASQYGGSAMGAANNPSGYKTADSTFYYYAASTGDKWMFQTYVGGVNKIRVVFRAAGALKSSNLTISKFCYDTEYFSSQGDRQVSIGEVSPSKASFASGEDGYMEFTVPEMAANSYAYFQTGSSNIKIYGIVLYSESSGSGGTIETDPTWSDGLNKNGSSVVDRNQGDPNFTYTISTTTNTLGGITYSSSNSSVAEVNATTGEVRITATGESTQTAVITATLARSGCYQPATRTYTVRVAGQECTITSAGTLTADKTSKCESDDVVLSLSGHDTDGTTVTWYRGETDVTGSVSNNTLTTSTPGAYSVVVSKSGCSLRSNTVNVTNISAATSATKIVDRWYVKNGRLTPDIALWRLDEGTTFTGVSWSPLNSTGLNFVIRDGIVYLEGKEPNVNSSSDIEYTLTLTIADACGTPHVLTDKTITLIHQKNTDKHVLAFVVGNTEKKGDKYVAIGKGFTESIPASQTTNVSLYNEIAKNFDVQATNIYSTDDEQKIKEYYSQFDIICITDYPNTKTKGSHSVSYSDAIGVMVDIRPVLTMEAWVSGLANWNKKGISGDPKSPSTRQYTMLLQCKDHEVFSGTTLTEVGEGDDKMYRIHMVDETQHPYDTLDANYGSGTHESKKGYRYGSYPALQGFTFSQAMEDADLLPLGLIDDGAGKDLQVGLERQHEMSARMMVLGINSTAMERLTADGKRIVINALKYLMKKNAEEIADCSTSFVGGADGDETSWNNADNWTGNTVPDKTQKVRILAPCVVPEGEKAHVAGVLIAPNDGGTYNGGSTPTTGSLTIAAGGALVVDGKIQAVTAPAYNRPRATTPADLAVLTNADAQGALIFDNSEGETQATVQMYSPSYWQYLEGTNKKKSYWSYVAVPIQDVNIGEFFYGAVTYLYDETSGWIRKGMYTQLHAFEGIGLSLPEGHTETFYGPMASTEDRTVTLTKTTSGGNGDNLIGNSWTAPIQIANFEASDFGEATQYVKIYSTGRDGTQDEVRENAEYVTATAENDGNVSAGQWVSIPINVPSLDGYDGLKVIPAMQAFQVTTGTETSLTLNYDKLVRDVNIVSDNLTEKQHAPARRSAGAKKSLMSTMRVRVSGVKTRTDVWLLEDDRFSDEFDNGWEAKYAECDDRSAQLYAQSEIGNMSFLAKPDIEGTVLGFAPSKDGNQYLFTFHYVGDEEYYLNDLKLTTATLISNENNYLFTYEEGDTNRFYISRQPLGAPAITTGVENPRDEAKPRKFIYNDKMYILFNGRVFDATGKVVK